MTSALSSPTSRYALALALSVGTVLFLLFGIGALGIVGEGDRDWLYLAAPAVLLVVAAAATTLLAGVVAVVLVATDRAVASIADVVMITAMYAALFAAAGWLFSRVPEPPVRVSDA